MFPGRLLPGMGHGLQDWMAQIGRRHDSPMTLLREQVSAIQALLAGEEVSVDGRYVKFDSVRLAFPPRAPPPLLIGGRGPRTLALAGELADGVILDDAAPEGRAAPDRVAEALARITATRETAGRPTPFDVVAFLGTPSDPTSDHVREQVHTLADAGVTRVAVLAGGVDGPLKSGAALLDFIDLLAPVAESAR